MMTNKEVKITHSITFSAGFTLMGWSKCTEITIRRQKQGHGVSSVKMPLTLTSDGWLNSYVTASAFHDPDFCSTWARETCERQYAPFRVYSIKLHK